MKIIDSFLFHNEFDMLKLRLEYLRDFVDYFVISECNYTFSGKEKPYYLDQVLDKFDDDLKSKIISVRYEPDVSEYDFSKTTECNFESGFWKVESGQRQHTLSLSSKFDDKDIFMLSDLDEIPNSSLIKTLRDNPERILPKDRAATLMFDNLYYNFSTYENSDWLRNSYM